jgi:hypothetical protein
MMTPSANGWAQIFSIGLRPHHRSHLRWYGAGSGVKLKSWILNSLFSLFLLSAPPQVFPAELSQTVQGFTLGNGLGPEKNPYYRKVEESIGKPLLFEKAKILYLIGQVRMSPCDFERNGDLVKGPKAASHLLMKYQVAGRNIETAAQFIEYLASRSSLTGRSYYVMDPRKRKHTLQEVLMNELFLLNQKLRESDLRGIRYRMIHPDMDSPV